MCGRWPYNIILKTLLLVSLFKKLQVRGLPANLIKKRLQHVCFIHFFLKNIFLIEHLGLTASELWTASNFTSLNKERSILENLKLWICTTSAFLFQSTSRFHQNFIIQIFDRCNMREGVGVTIVAAKPWIFRGLGPNKNC